MPVAIGGMKEQVNVLQEERLLAVAERQRLNQPIEGDEGLLRDVIGVLDHNFATLLGQLPLDFLRHLPHVFIQCTRTLHLFFLLCHVIPNSLAIPDNNYKLVLG